MIFTGCSDGGASFDGESLTVQPKEVTLVVGEEMTVEVGDKLQTDNNTVINVIHEIDSPLKKVTLLSGTATLIKGDYVLLN